MKKPIFPLLLAVMFSLCGCQQEKPTQYIGIVSAMDGEITLLLKEAKIVETKTIGNVTFYRGELRGKNVVITRAGIGKINASSAFTCVLNSVDISKVLFTGVAGGVKEEENVFDQVISTKIVEHDYGYLGNDGFLWCGGDPGRQEPGEYYEADPALVNLAYDCSIALLKERHVYKGVIASGDQFIASSEYVSYLEREFDAYACEMEGAAVAKVCEAYGKPFVVMRTLSDKADGMAKESYVDFMQEAADQSCSIVLKMLESL